MRKCYKLGETKEERQEVLKDTIKYFESGMSLESISKIYGVTKQAISLNFTKNGYYPSENNKRIKRHNIENNIINQQKIEIEKLTTKIKALRVYNAQLRQKINQLTQAKEV